VFGKVMTSLALPPFNTTSSHKNPQTHRKAVVAAAGWGGGGAEGGVLACRTGVAHGGGPVQPRSLCSGGMGIVGK